MRAIPVALFAFPLLLASCNKEPGEGGKAEIRGIVYEQEYNASTGLPIGDAYPLADFRVSIIYGSDGVYPDDDARTNPQGHFRFPWLRKGDYRIYVITECADIDEPDCVQAVYKDVSVGDRKEVVEMDTIFVSKY